MWIVFTVAMIVLIYIFLISPAPRRHPDSELFNNLYIAHRGLHDDKVPENSLAAFKKAIENGYAVEIDIHVTKDDKVVIFHDDDLNRVCDTDKLISNLTLDEVKKYRIFDTEHMIPTLEELLEICTENTLLVIEYKCDTKDYLRLCEKANEILNKYSVRYIVQSFNPIAMRWFKKNRPDICRGQLATDFTKERPTSFIRIVCGYLLLNCLSRPDFISYDIKYNVLSTRICVMFGALKAGWTIRSQKELDACKAKNDAYIFENFIPN